MFIGGRLTSSRTATTFVSPNGLNAVGSALITPYDINGNVSIQASNNGNRSIVLKGLGGGGAVLIGNITTGNGTNYSAILQADSTNQGFLPPRTNLTSNISTPAQGLMAYLTGSTNEGLYYYNSGSAVGWHKVLTNSGSQDISGSLNVTSFTASNATISGNVTVLGTASINTLIVNQTQFTSGSNQLGDAADDFQTLYGTVRIPTGSLTVSGALAVSSSQNSYD